MKNIETNEKAKWRKARSLPGNLLNGYEIRRPIAALVLAAVSTALAAANLVTNVVGHA